MRYIALIVILLFIFIYQAHESFMATSSYVRLYNMNNMWAEYTPQNLPNGYLRTKQSGDITRVAIDLTGQPGIVEIWAYKPSLSGNTDTTDTSPQKTTIYDMHHNTANDVIHGGTFSDERPANDIKAPVRKSNNASVLSPHNGRRTVLDCNHAIMNHPDWIPIVRAGPGTKGIVDLLIPVHESFIYIDFY